MYRYETTRSIYMPYINLLQLTVWAEAWAYIYFTLLAYAPEQICLHLYVPLHFYCTIHMDQTLLHTSAIQQETVKFIYHANAIYLPATNMHLKWSIYATCVNYMTCIKWGAKPIYMSHMNSVASTMWLRPVYMNDDTDTNNFNATNTNNMGWQQVSLIAKLTWPAGRISQKLIRINMLGDINASQGDNILYLDT